MATFHVLSLMISFSSLIVALITLSYAFSKKK